ncbi:hypothetical protein SH528x_002924 [Novipirellula sp. SH528]|uniref:hypothetical protein n=1 Tax=Novipirellula sp. SH528 TaxID=3454466 RepID=UPI003FA00521
MQLPLRIALLCIGMTSITHAQFLAIELRSIRPATATVGQSSGVSVTGDRMDEVDQLLFSHPEITATLQPVSQTTPPPLLSPIPKYGHFDVAIADDVPPGRYEVRAIGRHGVSNPRAFWVSKLAVVDAAVSHDFDSATPLPTDQWHSASSSGASIDFYAVELTETHALIHYRSQTIDSPMIGQLRLYNAAGEVVASARGADGFDPVLRLQDQPPGKCVLAVNEYLYRSGAEYLYQVSLQSNANSEAAGAGVVLGAESATALEIEPAAPPMFASSGGAERIELPYQATWWFAPPGDENTFEFDATKGEVVAIDVISQRLGEPTDARVILDRIQRDDAGVPSYQEVARSDDGQAVSDSMISLSTKDPSLLFTAPATATYRLTVRDLDIGTSLSEQQRFVLRVANPDPGFTLVASRVYPNKDVKLARPHGSKLFRGGGELVRVFAIRREGWAGPIEITAENLPAGIHCKPATIAANQTQTDLTLTAADDATAGVAPIRIVGRSIDHAISETAVAATLQMAKGGGRDYVRSRIASDLVVAVSEHDISPITIRLDDEKVPEVKAGQELPLTIKLTRREGGKDVCVLRPLSLPAGVTIAEVTVPADKSEAAAAIKTAANAAVGTYSFAMLAETKVKVRPNPQALAAAQQARAMLQTLHDDPAQAANLAAIKAALAEADKRIEVAKKAHAEQALTVFIPSNHVTFRVVSP